jgi:6-phosphogluconolactonase
MRGGGSIPRGFILDPSGNWLARAIGNSNIFATFKVDRATGKLTPTGDKFDLGSPVTFVFLK